MDYIYSNLTPIRKTVIKDSIIDFRNWRNKEGIGPSFVDFTGANIVSSRIECTYLRSSTISLDLTPVNLLFNNLTLDRTVILMNDLDLWTSGSFTLDFYDYAEVKCASTFRNSLIKLNAIEVNERTRISIFADRCNWNNSTLRLENATITATAADAGGISTFLINTDANDSLFNFSYLTLRNDENGYGNNFVIRGNYNSSTVSVFVFKSFALRDKES